MKKKIFLRVLISLLVIVLGYESYLYGKDLSISNKPSEVSTKDIISKNKSIAIMVQDSETDNWHEATDRNSWPSPTTHGFVGAECTDSDGASIDYTNILQFNLSTYHATIDTKNSIYCTLYFAKGRPALQALNETKGSTLNLSTAVDGMYRYKGTTSQVINNYICFGTTDKNQCLKTPDTYMYRIIGITSAADTKLGLSANQLKIIKATPSAKEQKWGSSSSDSSPWDSSQAKNHVTTWYNTNIKGATPNGTYWDSIVTEQKWYNADQTSSPTTTEPKGSQSAKSKVALMYGTDYYNAGTQNTTNWLYVKNGWSTSSTLTGNSLNEWTMSRYGYANDDGNYFRAWGVYASGYLGNPYVNNAYAVRPVFYLQSEINLTGTGKSDDPFRITTKNNA